MPVVLKQLCVILHTKLIIFKLPSHTHVLIQTQQIQKPKQPARGNLNTLHIRTRNGKTDSEKLVALTRKKKSAVHPKLKNVVSK